MFHQGQQGQSVLIADERASPHPAVARPHPLLEFPLDIHLDTFAARNCTPSVAPLAAVRSPSRKAVSTSLAAGSNSVPLICSGRGCVTDGLGSMGLTCRGTVPTGLQVRHCRGRTHGADAVSLTQLGLGLEGIPVMAWPAAQIMLREETGSRSSCNRTRILERLAKLRFERALRVSPAVSCAVVCAGDWAAHPLSVRIVALTPCCGTYGANLGLAACCLISHSGLDPGDAARSYQHLRKWLVARTWLPLAGQHASLTMNLHTLTARMLVCMAGYSAVSATSDS